MRIGYIEIPDFLEQNQKLTPLCGAVALAAALSALAEHLEPWVAGLDTRGALPRPGKPSCTMVVCAPSGQSSRRFADKLVREIARFGYQCRVGVADDTFTAMVAARTATEPVTVVPRGREAEFLAPHPIEFLPLPAEVIRVLRDSGVTTLGGFARLPPPTVDRPRQASFDYRALARGGGPRGFHFARTAQAA